MAIVTTGRLLGSVLLSLISIILIGTIASLAVLDQFEPKAATAAAGLLAVYLLSFAGIIWRRLSGQYGFTAVEGPEGVRIRRGLLQTISETVPYGRIQAVRQVEPLLWRPLGWCRLEVDVAGATARNQRGEGTSVVRKALLPVGSTQDSWHLLARLLGAPDPPRTAPPRRARWKAPLSFHFLSAGFDESHAMCVTGRINKATTWVPFEKTQSIRRVQGPAQRPLGLATVHVDVAGRRTRAEFRDRAVEEADRLVDELTGLSRRARQRRQPAPAAVRGSSADGPPSGWYPDPSGRHEQRYWHDGRWTEQVSDGGRRSAEAIPTQP
jgi:putative membrane protein